ncbi:MAG: primosomal protein N' [Planctomycetota bacterium]
MSGVLFGDSDQDVGKAWVGYVTVAVERGFDGGEGGLTYGVSQGVGRRAWGIGEEDDERAGEIPGVGVGDRVVVPLGRKRVEGVVVGVLQDLPEGLEAGKVRGVERVVLRSGLPEELIGLARWIAGYYVCPLGMVLQAMTPAGVRRGVGQRSGGVKRVVRVMAGKVEGGRWEMEGGEGEGVKLTKLQRRVMEVAREVEGGWVEEKELADRAGAKTVGPVRRLVEMGVLEERSQESGVWSKEVKDGSERVEVELSAGQAAALRRLREGLGRFGVHLLHGVTGSGKTEVYLRLIEGLVRVGRSSGGAEPGGGDPRALGDTGGTSGGGVGVIVLVPEIALTPQTVARFVGRFERVAVLHSGLTPGQRHAEWQRVRAGEVDVVVGARSAVFAPLPRLGLIVVDEEHDGSYKQDQLPRYHARDVAIKRAQGLGIPVVLGSATPALESYARARRGAGEPGGGHPRALQVWSYLSLPERVPGAVLPRVEVVDMVQERRERRGVHLMSRAMEKRLEVVLDGGGQAMLLLNRRGYANYIACTDHACGWQMACDHCDAMMVYHVNRQLPKGGLLKCHHCGAETVLPSACPVCGKTITVFGLGTQRVEEEFQSKFPGVSYCRMDSDTMKRAGDYERVLGAFGRGETRVLMGTQMIAKGLDFPGVRLVGVISADTSLNFPDFRSAERTFQLIAQVAGRSGRGTGEDAGGRVVVQSFSPSEPAVALAATHDYAGFAEREMKLREASGLPPSTRMVRIVCRDKDQAKANVRAGRLAAGLREAAGGEPTDSIRGLRGAEVRVRGPMPCPIARVADHYRVQVELIGPSAGGLQRVMTALRNAGELVSDAHTAVDVDPIALL